jgi:hypothetical protein
VASTYISLLALVGRCGEDRNRRRCRPHSGDRPKLVVDLDDNDE